MKKLLAIALFCVSFVSMSVQASIIEWTIQGATFNDGGTLTGTFSTDSVTGGLVDYSFVTSAGSAFGGFAYTSASSDLYGNNIFGPNSFVIVDTIPFAYPLLSLMFVNSLNVAGTNNMVIGNSTCNGFGAIESNNDCSNYRFITAGLASSDVPEPTTLALLGLGLLGFAAARRRQQ